MSAAQHIHAASPMAPEGGDLLVTSPSAAQLCAELEVTMISNADHDDQTPELRQLYEKTTPPQPQPQQCSGEQEYENLEVGGWGGSITILHWKHHDTARVAPIEWRTRLATFKPHLEYLSGASVNSSAMGSTHPPKQVPMWLLISCHGF